MKCSHTISALLMCAVMGTSGALHAQAHGPLLLKERQNENLLEKPPLAAESPERPARIAEMQAFLDRLVGRFLVDGTRTWRNPLAQKDMTEEINGTAECAGIGAGAGTRCVIQYAGPPSRLDGRQGTAEMPPSEKLLPMLYFGINPTTLEIQSIAVDIQGVAARTGVLNRDRVSFPVDNWKVCHRVWNTCWVVAEIAAPRTGEVLMRIATHSWAQGSNPPKTKSGYTNDMTLRLRRR